MGVMRIVLLMSRDFAPYWKWLPFEFRKRVEAQPCVGLLEELVSIRDIERQVEIVQSLCALVHPQLLDGGWVTGQGGKPLHPTAAKRQNRARTAISAGPIAFIEGLSGLSGTGCYAVMSGGLLNAAPLAMGDRLQATSHGRA